MRLIDKYQPKDWPDIIGNAKAVAKLRGIVERPGFSGDAFAIVGPSGCGKSTLADVVAGMFCEPWNIHKLDGHDCNVDAVRDVRDALAYTAMASEAKPMRAWIINEHHGMTAMAVQAWLTTLDHLPLNTLFFFTTTEDTTDLFGQFSRPFSGRLKEIGLTNQGLVEAYAIFLQRVARAEGLDGQELPAYIRYVKDNRNDLRRCLQGIDAGDMVAA